MNFVDCLIIISLFVQAAMGVSGEHSKHATFNQCWFNAGSPCTTLSQYLANIGALSNVCGGGHI